MILLAPLGLVIYVVAVVMISRFFYRRAIRSNPEFKFSYTIVDIWTAIIAFTPTFLFMHYSNQHAQLREIMVVEAVILVCGQLAGIAIAKCLTYPAPDQVASSIIVLVGALLGLFIPFLVLFGAIFTIGPIVVLARVLYFGFPLSMFFVVLTVLVISLWKRAAR